MIRGGFAFVTNPKEALLTFPSGVWNCAWLNALNNSARNSALKPSLILVSLRNAMSQLFSPGPEKNLRRDVPNVPSASCEKSAVLKYGLPERGSLMLSDPGVKFGVSTGSEIAPALLVPSNELSSVSRSVTGWPLENRVIPLMRHPFTNRLGPCKRSKGNW